VPGYSLAADAYVRHTLRTKREFFLIIAKIPAGQIGGDAVYAASRGHSMCSDVHCR